MLWFCTKLSNVTRLWQYRQRQSFVKPFCQSLLGFSSPIMFPWCVANQTWPFRKCPSCRWCLSTTGNMPSICPMFINVPYSSPSYIPLLVKFFIFPLGVSPMIFPLLVKSMIFSMGFLKPHPGWLLFSTPAGRAWSWTVWPDRFLWKRENWWWKNSSLGNENLK